MIKISNLQLSGIIRMTLACAMLVIFFIALYDLFHPNSSPSLGTGIVVVFSVVIVFFVLRIQNLPFPRSMKRAMLILFSVGCLIRLTLVIAIPNKQVSDFQIFHELAVALSNGKGLAYDGPTGLAEDVALYHHRYGAAGPLPTAFRMPGTPLIMASLYACFGPRPVLAKILNALLGSGIGICLLWLMWMNDPRRAFLAGLIWEIDPSSWFNTCLLGTEIHFTFGILLAAVLLTLSYGAAGPRSKSDASLCRHRTLNFKITMEDDSKTLYALTAGLVMGCVCLIRPSTQLIFCMIAVSVWHLWKTKKDRSSWKKPLRLTLLTLFGITLPLTAWGIRNYRAFGVFEWQSTEIGFNFLTMTQDIVSPPEEGSLDSLMKAFYRSRDEFEIARLAKEIGIRRLCIAATHPTFAKTLVKNFMRTWKNDVDGLSWCLGQANGAASVFPLLKGMVETAYLSLIALALLGIIGTPWREIQNPGVVMLFLYFLGTCLLLCIFQGQSRYHFPLMPFFCICAAYSAGKGRIAPFAVDKR